MAIQGSTGSTRRLLTIFVTEIGFRVKMIWSEELLTFDSLLSVSSVLSFQNITFY